MRAYWPKGGCSAASHCRIRRALLRSAGGKLNTIFSSVREKREMINSACRSGREQERPQLAHLLVVLRSVKCSTIWPGLSGSVEFCSHLGITTCRCLRNNSSCGKVSSKSPAVRRRTR